MNRTIRLIHQLIKDRIPLNIVTIEDEMQMRKLFNITEPAVSFKTPYDRSKVNIALSFSKEETRMLLGGKAHIHELMLKNEYYTYSELKILSQGKELISTYDCISNTTPAEEKALNSDLEYPGELLRENLRSQCKVPPTRAVRVTGKFTDAEQNEPPM
ncbi:hypothetical protein NECID01_1251 [Nematocida sp. AWRm77]|nr:hypothetical protein NECID01_1251 [Nematocida sp. AWRm77]